MDFDALHGLGVELLELPAQQRLRRQRGLILGDQRGRRGPGERVLDDLVVLRRAQQDADRRPLVRLLDVAIERLEIKPELAEILGLELAHLELDRDQAGQLAMKEHEIDRKITITDLDRVFRTDKAKVATELADEATDITQQRTMQIDLRVRVLQVEEFEVVRILEFGGGGRMDPLQRGGHPLRLLPTEGVGSQLAIELARGPLLADRRGDIEVALIWPLRDSQDQQMVSPRQLCQQR